MFARIENDKVAELFYDLRANHPEKLWPADLSKVTAADLPDGIVQVTEVPQPRDLYTTITDGGYVYDPETKTVTRTWVSAPLTLSQIKDSVRGRVTARRWELETGGLIMNGFKINTSVESQNRLTNALVNGTRRNISSVRFKDDTGDWITMTMEQLTTIVDAMSEYCESCFDAEAAHHQAINSITDVAGRKTAVEQLSRYDIESGWPSNVITA